MLGFGVPNNYCLLQADIGTFAYLLAYYMVYSLKVFIDLFCLKIVASKGK